ncbi:MAG: 3-phosphoshikimate 1-carboxyvinyltransferase [Deltaproteobacteria bacterium]|nr:3-phosphoshikimate 1-carboxyvinyltransferase [Deltaproteobacteria bacterium]
MSAQVKVFPVSKIQGVISVPGDKSISHRSIIFASLSEGKTRIQNLLEGEDVLCTIDCFREMGVSIEKKGKEWIVQGVGLQGLKAPRKVLYCGNSGTTTRLLMGILAAQPFESVLTGDASLNRRPMKRVIDPLTQMGARFHLENDGSADRHIHIQGGFLRGIDYQSPIASAQVKSALLLAGLWAEGTTSVTEPSLSRDHTERVLSSSGVPFQREGLKVTVSKAQALKFPNDYWVPGDFSSAAFFLVAGALVPNSQLLLKQVGLNPTRIGAFEVLKEMGALLSIENHSLQAGEEVGDVKVESSPLNSTKINGEIIPKLIDEIPILAVAAARANGLTEIHDAAELKVKESDRIEILCQLLSRLKVQNRPFLDGLEILGPSHFESTTVASAGDHRMAMSMAIAALVAEGPIQIEDIECVKTSFPSFWDLLAGLGVRLEF